MCEPAHLAATWQPAIRPVSYLHSDNPPSGTDCSESSLFQIIYNEGNNFKHFLKKIKLFNSVLDFVPFYVYDYFHRMAFYIAILLQIEQLSFYLYFITVDVLESILL